MFGITKAEIAAELEKVTAGVYRAKAEPRFVATLREGKGFRHWSLTFDGIPNYDSSDRTRELDLGGVVWRLRHIGVCSECSKHTGLRRLDTWKGNLGERRVCGPCLEVLRGEQNRLCAARDVAFHAVQKYDEVRRIREAPTLEAALGLFDIRGAGP